MTMTISRLLFVVVAAVGIALADDQITLTVDGISNVTCQVQSWSFGVTDPTSNAVAQGGKAQLSPLALARPLDQCSATLFKYSIVGQRIKTVVLTQYTVVDGMRQRLMVVTLSDAVVSTYQIGGTQTNPLPLESVGFVFGQIEYEYFTFTPSGAPGGEVNVTYNVQTNRLQ
jgi:type VI secretion system secreted protein Hcp